MASAESVIVAPEAITFGPTHLGNVSGRQIVYFFNGGPSEVSVTRVALASPFAEIDNCSGRIAPGGVCVISISVAPTTVGPVKGVLLVSSFDGQEQTDKSVDLSVSGLGDPMLVLSQTDLSFPDTGIGTSSPPRTITVSNSGEAPLTIKSVTAGPNFLQTNTCGQTVEAKSSCVMSVVFSPSDVGNCIESIELIVNDSLSPHVIRLRGTATKRVSIISASAMKVEFQSQVLDETGPSKAVEFTNLGTAAFDLLQVVVTDGFEQANDCSSTIGPGRTCTVWVSLTSKAVGKVVGSLRIKGAEQSSGDLLVSLSGTIIGYPKVSLSTSGTGFGTQAVGQGSQSKSVVIANTGTATLRISQISVSGQFGQSNDCATLEASSQCSVFVSFNPLTAGETAGILTIVDNAPGSPHTIAVDGIGSAITGVWANEGGDKVAQEELRASRAIENLTGKVRNRAWDGQKISLFGAANESVSFNLVLEAASTQASNVSVTFDTLIGPGGVKIETTHQASGDDLFNYVGRPIELFYVRYLQIKGVSSFGYDHYNEGQIPARFRAASHLWTDRPDHDLHYPDVLVPAELVPTFTIAQGQNQSIWSDIFIAKNQLPGTYTGTITVKENGLTTYSIPVVLTVKPFVLPDTPTYTAFTYVHSGEIEGRWFGQYTNWSTPNGAKLRDINDRYVQFLKRHRITTIGAESECAGLYLSSANCGSAAISVEKRFDGSLFTPEKGYDGPGIGQGLSLYSYGSYGTWNRTTNNAADMWRIMDPVGAYFHSKFPGVKPFIYLIDEPSFWDFPTIENWSKWLAEDPGPGHFVKTLSTTTYSSGLNWMPHLDIPMEAVGIGECSGCPNGDNVAYTQSLVTALKAQPDHEAWMYNYWRPGSGTSNTEDDGTAMRTFGWIQAKMQISHHFYWWANIDSQNVDLLAQACTWGCNSHPDGWWGQASPDAFTNGNGLLLYPGTDNNPGHISYGVNGPLGSLRLKEWRRGLQDADYLAIARQIDAAAVQAIIQQVMPKALWENPAPHGDVSATTGEVSWSSDPDVWESARVQLAAIISTHCASTPSDSNCRSTSSDHLDADSFGRAATGSQNTYEQLRK